MWLVVVFVFCSVVIEFVLNVLFAVAVELVVVGVVFVVFVVVVVVMVDVCSSSSGSSSVRFLALQSVISRIIVMIAMSPNTILRRSFILRNSCLHFMLCCMSSSLPVGISTSIWLIVD